jgi:hypothetical protein
VRKPSTTATPAAEAAPEEFGHGLVHIEDHGDAHDSKRQCGEHQEVRQRVDLDEPVSAPPVGSRQGPAGAEQEREVLADVRGKPSTLMALDTEPPDVDTIEDFSCCVTRPPKREDVHLAARCSHRFGLATDPWILLVIGVREHRHGSPPGCRFGGRHERRAAYRNRRFRRDTLLAR